jgi:hypothetical protein
MKKKKKLVLAKETLATLGSNARGGYLGDLYGRDDQFTKTCITCYASCDSCYCLVSDACTQGSCQICIPL